VLAARGRLGAILPAPDVSQHSDTTDCFWAPEDAWQPAPGKPPISRLCGCSINWFPWRIWRMANKGLIGRILAFEKLKNMERGALEITGNIGPSGAPQGDAGALAASARRGPEAPFLAPPHTYFRFLGRGLLLTFTHAFLVTSPHLNLCPPLAWFRKIGSGNSAVSDSYEQPGRVARCCGLRAHCAPAGQSRDRAAEGDGINCRAGWAGECRGRAVAVSVRVDDHQLNCRCQPAIAASPCSRRN